MVDARRVGVSDATTQQAIEQVRVKSNETASNPLLDGQFIRKDGSETLAVTAGTNNFRHSLGRPWRGYIVTYSTLSGQVYQASNDLDPRKEIQFVAAGSGDIRVWVF